MKPVVGEDSCESLGEQGGQTHPKGDQSWVFIGGTDVEAESPILMRRTDSFEKTLMLGKTDGRRTSG